MLKHMTNEERRQRDVVSRQMESEFAPTLTIKNFSCIKNLTIEFKRFVIFIGEQASGKSVTCKLYYFFTQVVQKVAFRCLTECADTDKFKQNLVDNFRSMFPETAWLEDSFLICWRLGKLRIDISHKRGNKKIALNLYLYGKRYEETLTNYVDLRNEWQRLVAEKHHKGAQTKSRRGGASVDVRFGKLESDLRSVLFSAFRCKFFNENFPPLSVDYIPAGRAFLAQIRDNFFSLSINDPLSFDPFLREFGSSLEEIRRSVIAIAEFKDLCEGILHGTYEFDGVDQWIVTDKAHKIRLSDASSGQQEALPLLMMLAQFAAYSESPVCRDSLAYRDSKSVSMKRIIIEEPEAHLYPTAQRRIVDFIGDLLRKDKAIGCIITTHSPFILCCANNVLKREKKLTGCISAYHLYDGGGDRIYDADLGLINAERFDEISYEIANA